MNSIDTITTLFGYFIYMASFIYSYSINWNKCNWFAIISFIIIIGFRGCGFDYFGYKEVFDALIRLDLTVKTMFDEELFVGSAIKFELAYLFIIRIISCFSHSSIWFFSFIAALQIIPLDKFIRKHFQCQRERMFIAFMFFVSLIFLEVFNGMRQFATYLLWINTVIFIVEKNFIKYTLCIAILYLFHSSALMLWPLYFIIDKKLLNNKTILIFSYLLFIILSNKFIGILSALMDSAYLLIEGTEVIRSQYLQSDEQEKILSRSALVYIFRISTFLYLIMTRDKIYNKYGNFGVVFLNLTIVGYFLQELAFNMGVYRLNYYFYYNVFVSMALALECNFDRINNIIPKYMNIYNYYIVFLYLLWFANCVMKEAGGCAPYVLSKELF